MSGRRPRVGAWSEASLAEAWDYYFDPALVAAWVDGFALGRRRRGLPRGGRHAALALDPRRPGRGHERSSSTSRARLHRVAFADPETEGELTTTLRDQGRGRTAGRAATRATACVGAGAFGAVTDVLFIRTQLRRSLQRSLTRLKHEVEESAHFS